MLEEVVEGELALQQLLRGLLGLVLLERLLGLLDERQHVAHAEDPPGHAVRVELLELGELLARGREGDRPADDLLDAQRRTAPGVAVQLGHDDAVDGEGGVERLGHADGVLAGHRVDDEEGVVGVDDLADPADLLHHLGIDGQAAGGVDDQHVLAQAAGFGQTALGRGHRVARLAEHRDIDLPAEGAQLLHGGRALEVRTDEQGLAPLALEPAGQLGRVGGLAGALQAGHQHHGGRAAGVGELQRLAAEHGGELAVDDLDDLLARVQRLAEAGPDGLLADAADDVADDADVDVGLQQRGADLLQHLVDIGLAEPALAAQPLDDAFEAG